MLNKLGIMMIFVGVVIFLLWFRTILGQTHRTVF